MKQAILTILLFMGMALPVWAKTAVVRIDGSSTVFPITEAVAGEFQLVFAQ